MTEWREDVKKVLLKAGLYNLPITFLFSDTQVPLPCSRQGPGWGGNNPIPVWYPRRWSVLQSQVTVIWGGCFEGQLGLGVREPIIGWVRCMGPNPSYQG